MKSPSRPSGRWREPACRRSGGNTRCRDRRHDAGRAGPPARPFRPWPSRPRRPRRHRGLSRRKERRRCSACALAVKAGLVVLRTARSSPLPMGRALVVRPGAGTAHVAADGAYGKTFGLSPRFFHVDPAAPRAPRSVPGGGHAAADPQRRRDRGHLRRSLRHARDGNRRHGADRPVGERRPMTMTGFATSVIACGCEAGIDWPSPRAETPDGRPGVEGPAVLDFARELQSSSGTGSANASSRAPAPPACRHRGGARSSSARSCATSAMASRSRSGSVASATGASRSWKASSCAKRRTGRMAERSAAATCCSWAHQAGALAAAEAAVGDGAGVGDVSCPFRAASCARARRSARAPRV